MIKDHVVNIVQQETEDLKQHIAELTHRIQQLEQENNFLRANASPELLNALRNINKH